MSAASDAWDPRQYDRFKAERSAPFFDLLALCRPLDGGSAVDLGCGTGELTAHLHRALGAGETLGIDNSAAMLEQAQGFVEHGLRFEAGDIGAFDAPDSYDLVFSNAALHWVPNHEAVLGHWAAALRPGGQLAVQVPANADHPSHLLSAALAREEPYVSALGGEPPPDPVLGVLTPERYASVLDELGFREQHVRLQVYGHHLESTAEVAEWTKGTSLTRFKNALPPALFEQFFAAYRDRLVDALGAKAPFFYPFKRILFWASR